MLICIATSGLPCNGSSLESGSLGGSETALISMARALAKRGHEVRVFCNCDRPGVYDGVQYFGIDSFAGMCAMSSVDVLIASRWFHFLHMQIPAGLRVLWLHDVITGHEEFMAGQFQTDLIMPLSDYHIENYTAKLPDLERIMWKTGNGVDMDLIDKARRPKVKGKLIFTSRPERGLHYLLRDILPEIIKRRPDVKLYFANYDTTALDSPPQVRQIVQMCDHMAKADPQHIVPMGHLHKEALYQQMSSAQLQLYPTDFPEIFCITAVEAQACGTPIVTTNDFALQETVGTKSGVLIDGKPPEPAYIKAFADHVCDLLDDQDKLAEMSAAGPEFVKQRGYVWDALAETWEKKFIEMFDSRWSSNKEKIVQQLVHTNDLAAASHLAEREGLEYLEAETRAARQEVNDPREMSSSPVEDFAAAQKHFSRLLELLKQTGVSPKRILDYRANDVAFGLILAKAYPTADVVVRAISADTASRIQMYADKSGLLNLKVLQPSDSVLPVGSKEYDLLVLHEVLEADYDPADSLKVLQNRYLSSGGHVLLSTAFGTRSTTKHGENTRLWNFDFGDFRSMFAGSTQFHAVFTDEDVSSRGELVGHWGVVFPKCTDVKSPDLVGKVRRTRPYQSLAVCMIAKNEENWLGGCLASLKHIADHIVICDTGSTDKTLEIAKEYGAEIRSVEFDNFSQARNASIVDLKEDWILWIDADERLAGSAKLRKYLSTQIFEGFGIRQNHLMLDIGKSFDVPIRLLRNKDCYRFTGLIHEHCERVDRQPFDEAIAPVLVIPDVDIVHYGYLNEQVRRQKCSNRNMQLLIRDVQESASRGRMLTWVLVIRDYLNFIKWSLESTQGRIFENSREHQLLCAAITTYRAKFGDRKHRYDPIAYPMYQEALQYLGRNGLTYMDNKLPPFEVGLTLTGAFGGLEDRNIGLQSLWFLNYAEFMMHIRGRGADLARALGASKEEYPEISQSVQAEYPVPDAVAILSSGCNVIPKRVY